MKPMRRRLALLLAVALQAAAAQSAAAQDYVTSTWVYLRRSPSADGARLRTLDRGDSLFARSVEARPGWLPVRTMDGTAGWVGATYVRSLATPAASAGASLITLPGGAPFTRIDSAWSKPALQTSTIRVQGGATRCGPIGDAADDDGTNLHKNRADVPSSTHLVTLNAIRSLPDTALWRFKNRNNWTGDDSALVMPYEGIPLTVEGYFEIVKPQKTSPPSGDKKVGEGTNCHSWLELDADWHIALVADPGEAEERAVVVEPTPRTKRNNAGWTPDLAAGLAVRRKPSAARDESNAARVRVTGFLLLDPVHPDHIRGKCSADCDGKSFFRATLWEIHPITRIEVQRNGSWIDLNELHTP